MKEFIIVSVNHTQRRDKYITLWNPNNAGYCYRTEVAGIYTKDDVMNNLKYYNSGSNTVAVDAEVIKSLAVPVEKGYLDNDGMVVKNNAANWKKIKEAMICETQYPLVPEYRGAPRLQVTMQKKLERASQVNEMIRIIADCGRRFFYSASKDRYASIEVDHRGRVWWIDDYAGKRIYTHYRYWNKGFSHGGTLRDLVNSFRDYITKGTPVPSNVFGPWPDYICNGNLWGYGEDMQKIRDAAKRTGIVSEK